MDKKIKNIISANLKVLVAFVFILSLFIFSGCTKSSNPNYKIDLEVWGVFDSSDVLDKITTEYKKINPHVGEIKYRKFTVDSYKSDLLDALASGQSPDIFWINNTWMPSFQDKVESAPNWLTNEKEFRDNFVDVVVNDFFSGGKIYAAPLSVDSLSLYYNKDIFNAAGITTPPKTWEEFNSDVRKTVQYDQTGNIVQAGAAIGTAYNINRSTDLLALLMMQNGAKMNDENNTAVTFDKPVNANGKSIQAGEIALDFYTQFAKGNSSVYTWNPRMHYSIDSFYEGTSSMMINYSWQYATIKSKNSKINFAVAPVPQLYPNSPINYANYWAMAVSKNKILSQDQTGKLAENGLSQANYNQTRIYEAWQFLKYLTFKNNGTVTLYNSLNGNSAGFQVKSDPAETYLDETMKPAARKDIIQKQLNDPILGPFAYGNLNARSWYEKDPETIENVLADTINSVNLGKSTVYEALRLAATRINQSVKK